MSDVTAIVLSAKPYDRRFAGLKVHEHISTIRTPQELCNARFSALTEIDTEWAFYLDDDDDLPINHEELIAKCIAEATAFDAAIVYTDELVKTPQRTYVQKSMPYSQDRHIKNFLLIHHLAIFRTELALQAIKKMPRGIYCPEMPLFFELAKSGAVHVPVIGYIWNKKPTGMHKWPSTAISWTQSAIWCQHNRA